MRTSEIIVPSAEDEQVNLSVNQRLRQAYKNEREKLKVVEIELNHVTIVMIDEHGNMKKVSLLSGH